MANPGDYAEYCYTDFTFMKPELRVDVKWKE